MRHNVRIAEPWKAKLLKKTRKCEFTYIVGEWCGRLLWLGRHQKPSAPTFDDFPGFQFLRILLPQSYSSDCRSLPTSIAQTSSRRKQGATVSATLDDTSREVPRIHKSKGGFTLGPGPRNLGFKTPLNNPTF
jgi:hypothetical protein